MRGEFLAEDFENGGFQAFGEGGFWVLIGDYAAMEKWLKRHKSRVRDCHVEINGRNSALPLLDLRKVKARVEPGAVIREGARLGDHCVIMMGAVVNIAAVIGARTMIDMNAVLGARAIVGRDCHVGAGAVIAGVLEPPSAKPVRIGDNVLVGANAVVLEGVRVGRGAWWQPAPWSLRTSRRASWWLGSRLRSLSGSGKSRKRKKYLWSRF